MNAAPFAYSARTEAGCAFELTWDAPRDVTRVEAILPPDVLPPARLRVEYWQSGWPLRGAGAESGDSYRGQWRLVDAERTASGGLVSFTFAPLNRREFPELRDRTMLYRHTLRLRVIADEPLPESLLIEAHTTSGLRAVEFEVEWAPDAQGEWDAAPRVFNGQLTLHQQWERRLAAEVESADTPPDSFDATVVTILAGPEPFSFRTADLATARHMHIPHARALVRMRDEMVNYHTIEDDEGGKQGIYARVLSAPEQTFPQAWNDMPPREPLFMTLGFEGARQRFRLDINGNVTCTNMEATAHPGKETPHCAWQGGATQYCFGLPACAPIARELIEGDLPMLCTVWETDGVRYRQTAFAVPLNGIPISGARLWADDPIALMMRIEIESLGGRDASVGLAISIREGDTPCALDRDGDLILAGRGGRMTPRLIARSASVFDRVPFAGGEGVYPFQTKVLRADSPRAVEIIIPYALPSEPIYWQQAARLRFDEAFAQVSEFWRARLDAGMTFDVPEPAVSDFYHAHLGRVLIYASREAGIGGCSIPRANPFDGGVNSGDAGIIATELDRRGLHTEAERVLDTWLHCQSSRALPGKFVSQEGLFHGAGGEEAENASVQGHGRMLSALAEHWRLTRDEAWLERALPEIVRACNWVLEERHQYATIAQTVPECAATDGLLPPGPLEGVDEWRCWFAANAAVWRGMSHAAAVLVEIGHVEGAALRAAAEEYRDGVVTRMREAAMRSPVVALRDGSWGPHVPSEPCKRGRASSWAAETRGGALTLASQELLSADDPAVAWLLRDYEDNRCIASGHGGALDAARFERFWFSHGGLPVGPDLLPLVYLDCDAPRHFIRSWFNAFASAYSPETTAMREFALSGAHDGAALEAAACLLARMMFLRERGNELWLGQAIPGYWLAHGNRIGVANAPTHFGPMSIWWESNADDGTIAAYIEPPRRNPPERIRLRIRHPQERKPRGFIVNGEPCQGSPGHPEDILLHDIPQMTEVIAEY